jgi:hypothetical protein
MKPLRTFALLGLFASLAASLAPGAAAPMRADSPLRASADGRSLVRADGQPFFWLGDTAWELFSKLTREEVEHYLQTRRAQKFTVLQAILLSYAGHHSPNRYGEKPFLSVAPEELVPNEAYFRHADWVLARAAELGFHVLVFPSWRYYWREMPQITTYKPILTPANARRYAEFVGRRYRDRANVLWGLGGDMLPNDDNESAIMAAFPAGLRAGGADQLITYHPGGNRTSATRYHHEPWLGFNMSQSGHRLDHPVWNLVGADWHRTPAKPAIDGETMYEDIQRPLWRAKPETPRATAYEIRRPNYAAVFSGAFGATYGANGIFQFHPGGEAMYLPRATWREALQFPGARQMQHLRALMESRPLLERVPDQGLLASSDLTGAERITATRARDGSFALIYTAAGKAFEVRLDRLSGSKIVAHWFDPRTGAATPAGDFPVVYQKHFVPPVPSGDENDWVLVLDDAARNFPPPGAVRR